LVVALQVLRASLLSSFSCSLGVQVASQSSLA
jgi:hypothetical protein